jgi:LysR family transcriptional regulator, glycine cleavage system transcriptional activator
MIEDTAALMDKILVADEILAGGLVPAFDLSVPYGAYYIVVRNFNHLSEPARKFSHWLQDRFSVNPIT